jgi:hypothetical protein
MISERSRPAEIYDIASDSESEIAADEGVRQAFQEIDAMGDRLSSQQLLQRYQETFMQEMARQAAASREAAWGSAEERIGPYQIRFW